MSHHTKLLVAATFLAGVALGYAAEVPPPAQAESRTRALAQCHMQYMKEVQSERAAELLAQACEVVTN